MARKIQVMLTCDLDEDDVPAVETVTFSYNGSSYAFELCERHLAEFHEIMDRFVSAARREDASRRRRPASAAGRPAGGPTPSRTPRGAGKVDLGAVREWARGAGYQVSDRGRVSAEVRQAYEAAHGG